MFQVKMNLYLVRPGLSLVLGMYERSIEEFPRRNLVNPFKTPRASSIHMPTHAVPVQIHF